MAKLKMEALARRAVRPHRGETPLELVAGTLAVGEAETRAAIAAGPLGDGSCPVATWFVASLDPTIQAAARARGPALHAASDAKKAKAQRLARLALVLEWAMARLRALTQERFPAEAAALPAGSLATKGTITWAKPLFDLHDYAMATRRFDLERELSVQPEALEAARAAVSTARLDRLGVMSLRALREHVELSAKGYKIREQSLPDIIVGLAGALECALELQVLEACARERTTSAPRSLAWLDTLLDDLDGSDPPSAIVARM